LGFANRHNSAIVVSHDAFGCQSLNLFDFNPVAIECDDGASIEESGLRFIRCTHGGQVIADPALDCRRALRPLQSQCGHSSCASPADVPSDC